MHCTLSVRLSLFDIFWNTARTFVYLTVSHYLKRKAVENSNLVELFLLAHIIADIILSLVA